MADRYLLESGAPDGYLLEDGSGVLILDCNDGFQYDAFQSPGFQSCPYGASVTPVLGFPFDERQALENAAPVADDTIQSWAVGPPLNAVAQQAWAPSDADAVVQAVPTPDDSVQAWAVQPPLNAVADQSWNLDDGERFVIPQVFPDTTEVVAGYVPPTLQAWAVDGGEVQAVPGDDPSVQSWAVGPPQNAVIAQAFNQPDEAAVVPGTDDTAQTYPIQPPTAATFDPSTGFPWAREGAEVQAQPGQDDTPQAWSVGPPLNAVSAQAFNQPDEAPYTTVADDTPQALVIQPPSYIPVFQTTAWPVDGGEVQSVPGDDPSVQSWAVGPPLNADRLTAWSGDSEVTQAILVPDESVQSWAVQPPTFDPSTVPWSRTDDIVQPIWFTPDDTSQAWAIVPPFNPATGFPFNEPQETPVAPWMVDAIAVGVWAATSAAITGGTGGFPPSATAYGSVSGAFGATTTPALSANTGQPAGSGETQTPGATAQTQKSSGS